MKKTTAASIAAAVAGALAIVAAQPVLGQDRRVKCYGVAKTGQNDCASYSRSHSCAGQAKKDYDLDEWKFVKDADTCAKMGGRTRPPR